MARRSTRQGGTRTRGARSSRLPAPRTAAIYTAGILAALGLSWLSLPIPLAKANPLLADRIAPPSGTIDTARAMILFFTATKPSEVEKIGRAALLAEPLSFQAASNLGMVYYVQGRRDLAVKLMSLVGNASLRDKNSHAILINEAIRNNDGPAAVREAEILARQNATLQPIAMEIFTEMVDRGMVIPSLARRLAEGAPWRKGFLDHLGNKGKNTDRAIELFKAMKGYGKGPTGAELDVWLVRRVGTLPPAEILNLWQTLSATPLKAEDRFVRGGSLEPTDAPRPFNWTFYNGDEGYAERDDLPSTDAGKPGGRVLFSEYRGSGKFSLASQWLSLPAGSYRFSVRAMTPFAISTPHVSVRISCVGMEGVLLSLTPDGRESDRWRQLAGEFSVPANCPVQSLEVVGEGSPDAGYEQFYLDDFAIGPKAGVAQGR